MDKQRNSGPFIRNGVDLFEKDKGIRWFISIFTFFFVIGIIVYVGVFINNISFLHTYFKNPGMPGVLTSDRYKFNWVITMLTIVVHVVILLSIYCMIIYRHDYGCNILWFGLIILFFGLLLFIIAAYSIQYSNCNHPTDPDNICNDLKWCCVNFNNPANKCPNSIPCIPPITQSDLTPNLDFLNLFWYNVTIAGLYLLFILIIIFYWFNENPEIPFIDEYETELYEPNVVKANVQPTLIKSSKKNHGLKERKRKK